MQNYKLLDTVTDEGILTLIDGSIWQVKHGDISIAICWSPTARVTIESSVQAGDNFPFMFTNLENKSSISVQKIN